MGTRPTAAPWGPNHFTPGTASPKQIARFLPCACQKNNPQGFIESTVLGCCLELSFGKDILFTHQKQPAWRAPNRRNTLWRCIEIQYSLPLYFFNAWANLVHWWGCLKCSFVCLNILILLKICVADIPGYRTYPALPGWPDWEGKSVPSNAPNMNAGSKLDPPLKVLTQTLVVCSLQLTFLIAGVFHWEHNITVH